MSDSAKAVRDRARGTPQERRHAETRAEILDAAWALCREEGLGGLSLRELGRRVGLKAQSLYAYFDSKSAIYDAMFRQGNEQLARRIPAGDANDPGALARTRLKWAARRIFDFCTEDPVRYQLLFQRTIPDFEPTPESYALALERHQDLRRALAEMGMGEARAVDLWTALITGLTDQQISNDPGGDRWSRLIDDAVDMFCDHFGIDDPA